MTALHPKADIKLVLVVMTANDPKPTFSGHRQIKLSDL